MASAELALLSRAAQPPSLSVCRYFLPVGALPPCLRCSEDSHDGTHREHPAYPLLRLLRTRGLLSLSSDRSLLLGGQKGEGAPEVQLCEESGLSALCSLPKSPAAVLPSSVWAGDPRGNRLAPGCPFSASAVTENLPWKHTSLIPWPVLRGQGQSGGPATEWKIAQSLKGVCGKEFQKGGNVPKCQPLVRKKGILVPGYF